MCAEARVDGLMQMRRMIIAISAKEKDILGERNMPYPRAVVFGG